MYLVSKNKDECSGCTACVHVCPQKCIKMVADGEGFYYPSIDKDNCINCGLCEKICPFETPKFLNVGYSIYASYLKDQDQRKKSSSGGIFYAISQWVISRGGIVYGAAFDDNFKLVHIGVENLNELQKLRGSKYLQSYLGDTFKEIKELLIKGKWVYFTGTGCQVAGLNSFLRKKYDKLITSDLVCHGAPSQLMFDWHIKYLQKKEHCRVLNYSFRDLKGWGICESYDAVSVSNVFKKSKIYRPYELSPYLYSFMNAYTYRYSCYKCKFATIPRQGDITLADYWGVEDSFPELDISSGVSLILINSDQGHMILNELNERLVVKLSNIHDAALCNTNLVKPSDYPNIRTGIYEKICLKGYEYVACSEFRPKNYKTIKILTKVKRSPLYPLLKCIKHFLYRKG